ncbi:MAG: hypothetical protein WBO55_04190 [Rhizobiaceae bacterium]
MADSDIDAREIEAKAHRLSEAVSRIRNAQADRDDVVVEMKQAARARLELLAQDLQPVFEQLPEGSDQFEFALTSGETPRLWIDMTAFVRMGRDRRIYEFVKDTRLGRTLLGETENRERAASMVTNYVAERILERERMIEGDWIAMRGYDFNNSEKPAVVDTEVKPTPGPGWRTFLLFFLAMLAGAAGMVAWAWFGKMPSF